MSAHPPEAPTPTDEREPLEAIPPGLPTFLPRSSSLTPTPLRSVSSDPRAFQALLEFILSRTGMTVGELALTMGVKKSSLSQYFNGRRPNPSIAWFSRFCEACGCQLSVKWK